MLHPSDYPRTIPIHTERQAVECEKSGSIYMGVGNKSMDEWIRLEWNAFVYGESRLQ